MTLFMTSCGGKKSSRNCGRILDTTRASLGKPFRILPTGNPTRANDDGKQNKGPLPFVEMHFVCHHQIILETKTPKKSKMNAANVSQVCVVCFLLLFLMKLGAILV